MVIFQSYVSLPESIMFPIQLPRPDHLLILRSSKARFGHLSARFAGRWHASLKPRGEWDLPSKTGHWTINWDQLRVD